MVVEEVDNNTNHQESEPNFVAKKKQITSDEKKPRSVAQNRVIIQSDDRLSSPQKKDSTEISQFAASNKKLVRKIVSTSNVFTNRFERRGSVSVQADKKQAIN